MRRSRDISAWFRLEHYISRLESYHIMKGLLAICLLFLISPLFGVAYMDEPIVKGLGYAA